MISVVIEVLGRAMDALEGDYVASSPHSYTFHCGEAGGVAAACGTPGVSAEELCHDISDAYEDADVRSMRGILDELENRRRRGEPDHDHVEWRETEAAEFDAALGEALRARDAGDTMRYSLMIGFTACLMYRHQDPQDEPYGPVRDNIIRGYREGSDEPLAQARGRLGSPPGSPIRRRSGATQRPASSTRRCLGECAGCRTSGSGKLVTEKRPCMPNGTCG